MFLTYPYHMFLKSSRSVNSVSCSLPAIVLVQIMEACFRDLKPALWVQALPYIPLYV